MHLWVTTAEIEVNSNRIESPKIFFLHFPIDPLVRFFQKYLFSLIHNAKNISRERSLFIAWR